MVTSLTMVCTTDDILTERGRRHRRRIAMTTKAPISAKGAGFKVVWGSRAELYRLPKSKDIIV